MSQHISDREIRQGSQSAVRPIPPFKDVALPALAAAIRAAKHQQSRPQAPKLPAFLCEEDLQS